MDFNRRNLLLSMAGLPLLGPIPRPRILVIGDSVAWGQGLLEEQKMQALLARKLFDSDGVEPDVISYACSGATIGLESGQAPTTVAVPTWWPREIPQSNPTLHEQLERVAKDHPDLRFDVILVIGGINDVNVRRIFNPKTTPAQVDALCRQYCRTEMGHLLGEVRQRFVSANPQVKVLVAGYYSVFSEASKINAREIGAIVKAMIGDTIKPRKQPKVARTPGQAVIGPQEIMDLKDQVVANSGTFRDSANRELQSAVADANAAAGGRNFLFVDPGITDEEAAFSPNPLIWGLKGGRPQDALARDRELYCVGVVHKPRKERAICYRASVGHPNVQGAARYAEKLFEALKAPVA